MRDLSLRHTENKAMPKSVQVPTEITRRRLLKRSVAAASVAFSVPMIVPAATLGKGGAVAPSERILMGAIGVGGRGSHDLKWLLGQGDIRMAAICDVQKSRREFGKTTVDKHYGNTDCRTYPDLRDFLAERTDIDAVLIATGDRWHATASMLAMRAGKDVYCEKPSCLTVAEGKQIVETAQRYGRVFQTGAQRLSEPNHVFAIEMARSGRLGEIHTVYADCRYRGGRRFDWLPAQPTPPREEIDWDAWLGPCPWRPFNIGYVRHGWYDFYDFATDIAMWGAHTIAQALAGLDVSDLTCLDLEYLGPDQSINTRLSNGKKMVLYRDPGNVWKPCKYWHGACGERFDGPGGWAGAADGYTKPDVSSPAMLGQFKKVLSEYIAREQRPMNHVRDFLDCVRSRRLTVAHPEVMYRSMAICLAADICDRLGRNLTFDLDKAEFVNDPEANRLRCRARREPWQQ